MFQFGLVAFPSYQPDWVLRKKLNAAHCLVFMNITCMVRLVTGLFIEAANIAFKDLSAYQHTEHTDTLYKLSP